MVAKRGNVAAEETPAPEIPHTKFFNPIDKRATTTKTTTISSCTTVTGCGVTDITKTTVASASVRPTIHVVIPKDPRNAANIRSILRAQVDDDFFESATTALGTLFFYIPTLAQNQVEFLRQSPDVDDVYIPRGTLTQDYWLIIDNPANEDSTRNSDSVLNDDYNLGINTSYSQRSVLSKRAEIEKPWVFNRVDQEMILLSWPPGDGPVPARGTGSYKYDSSAGEGTFFYSVDYGVAPAHEEFSDLISPIEFLYPGPFPASGVMENDAKSHGSKCIAKAVGRNLGVAKKARVTATIQDYKTLLYERWLDALLKVHEDIRSKARGTKSVVNMSISIKAGLLTDAYIRKMGKHRYHLASEIFVWTNNSFSSSLFLAYVIGEILALNAVFTTGAGNTDALYAPRIAPDGYPALFGDPRNANYIRDLIVVGASHRDGSKYGGTRVAPWITCFAPGWDLDVPTPSQGVDSYNIGAGTSYCEWKYSSYPN